MNQTHVQASEALLVPPESPASPETVREVEAALEALRQGRGVLVTDDHDRENEADVIFPAQSLTEEQMALLIRECSGIVCLCLPPERIEALGLPMMVERNESPYGTAFTVSIEATRGVTTGVSAADRVATVRAASGPYATRQNIRCPGHVFPLRARPGGVRERRGHTEATVDLMRLAGLDPAGVLCELTNPDGTMAKGEQVRRFGREHGLPVVSVEALALYREDREARR